MVNLALPITLTSVIHYKKMTDGVSWGKQALTYPPLHHLAGKRSPCFQLTTERWKGGKKGRIKIFIAGMGCAFGSTGYHQLTKLKIHISSEKPWFYWLHPCQAQMMNSLNFGTSPTRSSMQGHPGGVRARLDTPPQGRDNSTGTAMKEAEFLLLKCPAQRGAPCSAWNPCSLPSLGRDTHSPSSTTPEISRPTGTSSFFSLISDRS